CLHGHLTARRSWVRFSHGVLLALGGRSSPDLQCSGGLSPGPFCVEFACSPLIHKGFPPLRTPTEKTCNRALSCPSLTKTDGSLHLVPGRLKVAHCSWGPGGRTVRDGKMQSRNSPRSQAYLRVCVCVCVLCRLHICT